jgi:hypothetical protein
MNIKIHQILVLRDNQWPDVLYLNTDLPNGMWPYEGKSPLKLEVASNTAEKYINENFQTVPYVIREV